MTRHELNNKAIEVFIAPWFAGIKMFCPVEKNSDAMLVLATMHKEGFMSEMGRRYDTSDTSKAANQYYAVFWKPGEEQECEKCGNNINEDYSVGETLGEAICRAALKAKGLL